MAINFDALPQDKPQGFALLEKNFYMATISKAEMKPPRNGGKDYLNLTLDCVGKDGTTGKVWDIVSESDNEVVRYKLARLIYALGLQLTGSFELKDLCKIIVNKKLVVDITVDEKGDRPRNVVDVFSNNVYYPVAEWAALTGGASETTPDAPVEISARDAEDVIADILDDADY